MVPEFAIYLLYRVIDKYYDTDTNEVGINNYGIQSLSLLEYK